MDSACFKFVGKVRGQGRPRHMKNGHTYRDDKDTEYQGALRAAYLQQVGRRGFGSRPVSIQIEVMRPLPKSRPKKVEFEHDTFKPDVDNIAKAVLDALNGLAFDDDKNVVSLSVSKHQRSRLHGAKDVMVVTVMAKDQEVI